MNTKVKHILTNNQSTQELIQQMKDKIPYTDIKWVSEENSDLWVLDIFNQKRNGTFVDCGAAGRSNSWNLEKFYDWNGVCGTKL